MRGDERREGDGEARGLRGCEVLVDEGELARGELRVEVVVG